MRESTERITSILLTVTALFFAGILAKREFFDGRAAAAMVQGGKPTRVANWDEILESGIVLGPRGAAVTVAEFADLECPACRHFNQELKEAISELHTDVNVVFVHYPLTIHRFARPAARALECSDSSGAAASFADVAYAKQDSFGLKTWTSYAHDAGIGDTIKFATCIRDARPIARVDRGRSLGETMKVEGTPTVIINGWRFAYPPHGADLREALKAAAAGNRPPGA